MHMSSNRKGRDKRIKLKQYFKDLRTHKRVTINNNDTDFYAMHEIAAFIT